MNEPKHTPGPWTVERMSRTHDLEPDYVIVSHGRLPNIATVNGRDNLNHTRLNVLDPFEGDANARLIASAPDLLALAEYVMHLGDTGITVPEKLFAMAHAAIRKATGEGE